MDVLKTFLKGLRQGNVNKEFFQAGLSHVQCRLSEGLSVDVFESVLDIILTSNLKVSYSTKLVGCLIPEEAVGNTTVDRILLWIISHHRTRPVSLLNELLRWLVGVVEYGYVDKNYVDKYYELIWGVLKNKKLEKATCHLVYLLTRPEDVFRGRVQAVLKMHEHNGKATHTMALLCLFKSYKPEYVPESVQMRNLHAAFRTLSQTLENYFKQGQDRLLNQAMALKKSNVECVWSRPFVKQKIIPDAAYVHLGSDRYHEKRTKIIHCLDKRSLLNSQQSIGMPSRVLSLLLNEGGIHLLSTHNHDVHVRFSYVVYYTLNTVFIEQKVTLPQKECEHFLNQLVDLEDYMQQGVPVVSRFLMEYMCTWDGLEYREPIYRLLEWITFKSYEELQISILDHLTTLFITSCVEEQCLIIRTLKTLSLNMYNRKQRVSIQENPLTFLGLNLVDVIDMNTVLPELTDFVGRMCRKGLQMSNGHPMLLHACVDFYSTVVDVEDHEKSCSIIPRACVYRCLLGPSTSMLSVLCDLLLRYYETFSKIRSTAHRDLFRDEFSMLEEYSYDMFNCLVRDTALSKASQGYIFANLPKNMLCNGDETFSVTSTVIIRSLIFLMEDAGTNDSDILEAVLVACKSMFKGLFEYLDLLQNKGGN